MTFSASVTLVIQSLLTFKMSESGSDPFVLRPLTISFLNANIVQCICAAYWLLQTIFTVLHFYMIKQDIC